MLLAAIVSRGSVDGLLDVLRYAPNESLTLLAYRERDCSGYWSLQYREVVELSEAIDAAAWLAGGSLGVYVLGGEICNFFTGFMPSGAPAKFMTCSLRRLGRQAVLTGNPPSPARSYSHAVLYSYSSRLIHEGAGPERLAAKIAERAGGGAGLVLALVSRSRTPAPVAAIAVSGRLRLCMGYRNGSAIVAAALPQDPPGWNCKERIVVSLYPASGVARIEVRSLDNVLYG